MAPSNALEPNYLTNRTGGHNKFYETWIMNENSRFVVYAQYGRIGNVGRRIRKTSRMSQNSASSYMNSLVNAKLEKGYIHAPQHTSYVQRPILKVEENAVVKETKKKKPNKRGFSRFAALE